MYHRRQANRYLSLTQMAPRFGISSIWLRSSTTKAFVHITLRWNMSTRSYWTTTAFSRVCCSRRWLNTNLEPTDHPEPRLHHSWATISNRFVKIDDGLLTNCHFIFVFHFGGTSPSSRYDHMEEQSCCISVAEDALSCSNATFNE